ncbi:hypothetical protein GCM10019996_03630 [Lentilactobacillus parakefiri]
MVSLTNLNHWRFELINKVSLNTGVRAVCLDKTKAGNRNRGDYGFYHDVFELLNNSKNLPISMTQGSMSGIACFHIHL